MQQIFLTEFLIILQQKPAKPPVFTKKIQPCRAFEQEQARFEVEFDGDPLPTIKWFREDFPIQPSADFQIHTFGTKSILIVRQVRCPLVHNFNFISHFFYPLCSTIPSKTPSLLPLTSWWLLLSLRNKLHRAWRPPMEASMVHKTPELTLAAVGLTPRFPFLLGCVRKLHPKGILSFSLMKAPCARQR